MSCAHTAIIPTNSAIDASAAASSTKIFNMSASTLPEHMRNIVPSLFYAVKGGSGSFRKNTPKPNRLVNATRAERKPASSSACGFHPKPGWLGPQGD